MLTVFRVMALGLLRDHGALTMTFLLPPLIFVVFAAIFAGVGGEDVRLRVALADQVGDAPSRRLSAALERDPAVQLHAVAADAADAELRTLLARDRVDAVIVIRRPLTAVADADAPVHVLADRANPWAAPMLAGRLQALIRAELPELTAARMLTTVERLVGGYTDAQRRRLATLGHTADLAAAEDPPLVRVEQTGGPARRGGAVSYYAGAIAMLFLLFTAVHGAASLVDERQTGVVDRLLIGPGGTHVVVVGKGLFLLTQGMLQVTLIFLVAWLGYGVDLPAQLPGWTVTTLAATLAAAGLALALAVACRTRQQVQQLGAFLVLIMSAVGGSMVPRFMMPPWLQELGWLTPNAWAVDAYQALFWRDGTTAELLPAWGVLAGVGITALLFALTVAHRLART